MLIQIWSTDLCQQQNNISSLLLIPLLQINKLTIVFVTKKTTGYVLLRELTSTLYNKIIWLSNKDQSLQ